MSTRSIIMLILWFVIIVIAMIGLFYLTFFTENTYYTRVDNTCLTNITPRGGMYYRYELPAFNEKGQERTVSFETSRVLRDDAYLRLDVAPIRGVVSWEEVQPEEIPELAQTGLVVVE